MWGMGKPLIDMLRKAIEDCGVSLNELGRQTGIDNSRLSRFMTGKRDLSLAAAQQLLDYFGLDVVKRKK